MKPPRINVFRMYRQRRFLAVSLLKYWWRVAAVLMSVVVVFMSSGPFEYATRTCYALVAMGYLWVDAYYNVKALERRHKEVSLTRLYRRKLKQRLEIERAMRKSKN